MGKKKLTLPANFDQLIKTNDISDLKEVFERCEWDARGGYSKGTALSFRQIPDEMVRWLVKQGADINAADTYKRTALHAQAAAWSGNVPLLLELGANAEALDYHNETPLHAAAAAYRTTAVRELVSSGANVHAESKRKNTPLAKALLQCRNIDITRMAEISEVLLDAGAAITPEMKESVCRIGKDFEFVRANYNKEDLDHTVHSLMKLYRQFDVEPVARLDKHDGTSFIKVKAEAWPLQHQELWDLLVPASGHAQTLQGEVIRITGRVSYEILNNGGGNWDADYRKMLDALVRYLGTGAPLEPGLLEEASSIAGRFHNIAGNEQPSRLSELAVQWVLANPQPVSMPEPDYAR